MTEIEKAYIAGIIYGEGSIMLQRFHKNQFPTPYVSVASTTIELLNWLKNTIGNIYEIIYTIKILILHLSKSLMLLQYPVYNNVLINYYITFVHSSNRNIYLPQ